MDHEPQQYLQQMRRFGSRQLGMTQGHGRFNQVMASLRARPEPYDILVKQYPPVLPPVGSDGPRQFADVQTYMREVVARGDYGKSVAPRQLTVAERPVDAALEAFVFDEAFGAVESGALNREKITNRVASRKSSELVETRSHPGRRRPLQVRRVRTGS